MPQAPPNSLLSSPSHLSPLAHFPLSLLSALDFVIFTIHLLLLLSLLLTRSHVTLRFSLPSALSDGVSLRFQINADKSQMAVKQKLE